MNCGGRQGDVMARIIYGVAGEGFGHSSRSHMIGRRLIDTGNDVMFVGSQKSLLYLKQYFGERVKEIFGLSFAFDGRRIDKSETFKRNLLKINQANRHNDELFKKHFEPFGPDLVISDFEPFSAWWAWRNNIPFISIDHEHMLTLCELDHPSQSRFSRITAEIVTECHYIGAVAYIILNFFRTPLRVDSAVLAPPVIRPKVAALETGRDGHILVYSTTGTDRATLLEVMQKFDQYKFVIYGFNESAEYGNCICKKRSTEGFLADLADSQGVIASAGFSLISECLHLRKKMLLLPVAGQYEQIINAHYVQKLGLGISAQKPSEATLKHFLEEIEKPMPSDEQIIWPDNEKFFQILQEALNALQEPVTVTQ
jgi:uncharacterized protein (TIGR00661 family)